MVVHQPQASDYSKASVEAFSESIASHYGFGPGDSLNDFVSHRGGQVSYVDVWALNDGHGALIVNDDKSFEIRVPNHTSVPRDRFTIAHELGHYFLHYSLADIRLEEGDQFIAYRSGSERVEWEANWFAAGFLMPSADFTLSHTRYSGRIADLAERYGVSRDAVKVRVARLGLGAGV